MSAYTVRVPVAGYLEAYVTADSEEDAIEKALNMTDSDPDTEFFYETMKHITQGNVFYGECNDIEVTLEDDED